MSKVIDKAIKTIEDHGFTQMTLYNPITGCYCTNGALAKALVNDDEYFFSHVDDPKGYLYQAVDESPEGQVIASIVLKKNRAWDRQDASQMIYRMNDDHATTKEDMLSVLREASTLLPEDV